MSAARNRQLFDDGRAARNRQLFDDSRAARNRPPFDYGRARRRVRGVGIERFAPQAVQLRQFKTGRSRL